MLHDADRGCGWCGMSEIISWIAAESDGPEPPARHSLAAPLGGPLGEKAKGPDDPGLAPAEHSAKHFSQNPPQHLPLHQFPATAETTTAASEAVADASDAG